MTRLTEIGWKGFWGGTAVLFGLVFAVHYNLYVMPDALSTTIGTLIGSYLFAWVVWRLVKFKMAARAPEPRFFVLVLATLSSFAALFPELSKLIT
jgi:uncharacterized membrane protein YccC